MTRGKSAAAVVEPDTDTKRGVADPDAWEAAKKVAKTIKKMRKDQKGTESWRKLPWREIREQLRRRGDAVDLDSVPPTWTGESPQMQDLKAILEEAGFKADGSRYVWRKGA